MTYFINASLNNGQMPEILKTSLIRPIHKQGNKTDCNNYRPISILSVVDKITEEIVVRRLTEFLEKYMIINKNQYGFQKGKNINQLLGNFANHINNYVSSNYHCLVLFIDFSKAFDTLSHDKLLDILDRNGIRGNCLNWFRNYLNCRTYRVKINNHLSEEIATTHGVPQGSKLGPLLYIIYANDMLNQLKECTAFAYADDTALIVAHKDITTACEIMQRQLDMVTKWCHDNGLVINAGKTKLMDIKPRHIPHVDINLKFHNSNCLHKNKNTNIDPNDGCDVYIETVNEYKYLGILIDQNFKWSNQIIKLQKKLRKAAYMLFHLSACTSTVVLRQAYYSLVESSLRHGITAWGSASTIRQLQITQNRVLKILKKNQSYNDNPRSYSTSTNSNNVIYHNNFSSAINNRNSTANLAKDCNVLNIKSIYHTTLANEFFNNSQYLQVIDHAHNTRSRSAGRFKVPQYKNNYGKSTLNVILPTIMNKLPLEILNTSNAKRRKTLIKRHFLMTQ